ncbi:flagellar assembly peptidoglycan hydrolase FlgJ [Neisseriaceae bacterium B2N2-7]|uniref:Flagellar assembly peptidoglycan hydrolase FlgJ n=1 Tax=Craterilacuibacter sinensis TaxID=2686017 RepID=A0A845BJH3_9NEIS|nr:flagellar assembly peptidoglycan hydrolase FlgJ [Craterilacuibacter sinensis]
MGLTGVSLRKHILLFPFVVLFLAACGSAVSQPQAEKSASGQLQPRFTASAPVASVAVAQPKPAAVPSDPIGAFTYTMLPHAEDAAQALGVDPAIIIAHAGLESGWGKKPIRFADGRDSYNLFSLKAYDSWTGDTVKIRTTEYLGGRKVKKTETFRAYPSFQAAFEDYASLLAKNQRYAKALGQGDNAKGFAQALHKGGYATDPRYVSKFASVTKKVRRVSDRMSA